MTAIRAPELRSPRLALVSAFALACSSSPNFFAAPAVKLHVSAAGAGSAGRPGTSAGGRGGMASTSAGHAGVAAQAAQSAGGTSGGGVTGGAAGTTLLAGSGGVQVAGSGGTAGADVDQAGEGGVAPGSGGRGAAGGLGGSGGGTCVSSPEVCDGVDNDCDSAIDEDGATRACGDAGSKLGLSLTLELARLESADENDFAKAWIAGQATMDGMVFFGANDMVWQRGSAATPQ